MINKLGVHARPAALFVKTAHKFASHITVEKDGEEVNGKSIVGLMMLAANQGLETHPGRGRPRCRRGGARVGGVVPPQVRRRMTDKVSWRAQLPGIGVSPGVAREQDLCLQHYRARSSRNTTSRPRKSQKEIDRFEQALIKTREQLHELQGHINTGIGSTASSTVPEVHLSITERPRAHRAGRQTRRERPQECRIHFQRRFAQVHHHAGAVVR